MLAAVLKDFDDLVLDDVPVPDPGLGEAVHLAVDGDVPIERLVSHRLPAERFAEAIELMRDPDGDAVKVVLRWDWG